MLHRVLWTLATSGGLLGVLGGCTSEFIDATATVSDVVGTVVTVQWTQATPDASYVEYGPTASYGNRTPLLAGGETSIELLGLHADETYHFRVVSGELVSEDRTVTTDPLPTSLPELELAEGAGGLSGYVPIPLIGSTYGMVIVDGEGEVVWYYLLEAEDTRGPRRVRVRQDGMGIFINDIHERGDAYIQSVAWNGELLSEFSVNDHNHDFIEDENGDLILTVYDIRDVDGTPRRGDKLVRLEPDGTQSDVWSVWDDIDFETNPVNGETWTHMNALNLDGDKGYYVGLRNFSTIVHVDTESGPATIDWGVGSSPLSTYQFKDGTVPFFEQHQFQVLDNDRLLVFDNHTKNEFPSVVVEYQLDTEARTLEEIWRYEHNPPLSVFALGAVHRYPSEDTLITWSTAGEIQLISPEGNELWRLNSGLGTAFGYPSPVSSLYMQR